MNKISYCPFFLGNAELTNLFKCKKQGHQCCAPKSLIREFNGGNSSEPILNNKNDTMYVTSRPYTTSLTTALCKLYIKYINILCKKYIFNFLYIIFYKYENTHLILLLLNYFCILYIYTIILCLT